MRIPHVISAALAIGLLASACSDGASAGGVDSADPAVAAAAENAEANEPNLQGSSDVTMVEVLDVGDGSITTLADAVDGDRPVLVWFYAPH